MSRTRKSKLRYKRKWMSLFYRREMEYKGFPTWRKWKLRYVNQAPTEE